MDRIVVVGGGVIGLSIAYELARRDVEVVVLEKGEPGEACSLGNAGWVVPALSGPVPAPGLMGTAFKWMFKPDSPLYVKPSALPGLAGWFWRFSRYCNEEAYQKGLAAVARLNRETLSLFDALQAEGVEFEMHADGLLFLFQTQSYLEHYLEDLRQMKGYGFAPPEVLKGRELRERQPGLSSGVIAGIWAGKERHVRPESLLSGLLGKLKEMGVEVLGGSEVRGVKRQGGRAVGVQLRDTTLQADGVILAAGAWTGMLASRFGFRLPLQAGKGYSVTVNAPGLRLSQAVYLAEARIACSPFDGALRLAGTMELSGINSDILEARIQAIKRGADAYLTGWRGKEPERHWGGLRPLLPDGLPAIGRAPGWENVYVATGHAMLGITLAPVTAKAIADLVVTGRADADLAPFDPGRFTG